MTSSGSRSISEKVRAALRDEGPLRVLRMAYDRAVHPYRLWRDRTWLQRRNLWIVIRSRMTGRPVVHAIGDSHTEVFHGVWPFRAAWIGPATAYNLDKENSTTRSKEKLSEALERVRKRSDVVLLVVGEIDSRIHIFNQYEKRGRTESIEHLIDATIERYGAVIRRLKGQGYRVAVHSVPATPYQDNIFEVENYADARTRARIVNEFNGRLSKWCEANAVEYLDMYSVVSDDEGFIRRDLTTDGTHLNAAAMPLYQEWVRTLARREKAK